MLTITKATDAVPRLLVTNVRYHATYMRDLQLSWPPLSRRPPPAVVCGMPVAGAGSGGVGGGGGGASCLSLMILRGHRHHHSWQLLATSTCPRMHVAAAGEGGMPRCLGPKLEVTRAPQR